MPLTIVIDPGHGGADPGAMGFDLKEKDLNLKICKRIVSELLCYQCTVKLTRKNDSSLSLEARAKLANSLNADFFLSIHINSGGGTGFESYVYRQPAELTVRYRSAIHSEVVAYLSQHGVMDRGRKSAGFAVLRLTKMPAVLLENLFIDNRRDVHLLTDEPFIAGLSHSIALGIAKALSLPLKDNPWDPEWEIEQLLADKIINTPKTPDSQASWGETATTLNRLRGVSPPSATWNPEEEISLLLKDNIINTPRQPGDQLLWGEFATALNRLRGREVTSGPWDPVAEINALLADRLLFSPRDTSAPVLWGEFATVLNRYR
ncbi:MAG: hypothetical protein JL50_04630 [Peptococcaceae bacterium BICA1-7]|nr:MAG: hypothetical protein JL50_04630 [Peptococcaceae bacterium BICA1-7]